MTFNTLRKYLGYASSKTSKYILSKQRLSNNVIMARALWIPVQPGSHNEVDIYLIEDPLSGDFIGIVLDGGNDLMPFMRRAYRRQGIMFSTMQDVIIPHMKQKRNGGPILSSAYSKAGEGLLTKLGFVKNTSGLFTL